MENLGIGTRVNHPAYGDGVIIALYQAAYDVCYIKHGIKTIGKEYGSWDIIEAIEAPNTVSFNDMEKSMIKILKEYNAITTPVELGDKWIDGEMILRPGTTNLKDKVIPIDTFFHKIVMVRDRVRVMEQRINSSKMTDEEKVNLQQYITRIYGSLTTFNVLFKYKEDHFTGERSKS